jgi:hypothetical protein
MWRHSLLCQSLLFPRQSSTMHTSHQWLITNQLQILALKSRPLQPRSLLLINRWLLIFHPCQIPTRISNPMQSSRIFIQTNWSSHLWKQIYIERRKSIWMSNYANIKSIYVCEQIQVSLCHSSLISLSRSMLQWL